MKKIIISFLLFFLLLSAVGAKADATASGDIPVTFQIGQPIAIDLIMPGNAESVRIKWQDLETVLSQKDSSNSENIYTCLLGTDLKNAKPGLYKLEAQNQQIATEVPFFLVISVTNHIFAIISCR